MKRAQHLAAALDADSADERAFHLRHAAQLTIPRDAQRARLGAGSEPTTITAASSVNVGPSGVPENRGDQS